MAGWTRLSQAYRYRFLSTAHSPADHSVAARIEHIHQRLRHGDYHVAYADTLQLLTDHRGQPGPAGLLVDVANLCERPDEALTVLTAQRPHLPPALFTWHAGTLCLLGGDIDQARRHADALLNQPDGGDMGLTLLLAIADRQVDPEARLHWMRQRERQLRQVPLALLLARWEVQAVLGQQQEILIETARLLDLLPLAQVENRAFVELHRAMALHDQLQFSQSIAAASALARRLASAPVAAATRPATVRIRTRRRQMQILAQIERLVLTESLPVVVHAGTLLGLTRDGDLLPGDQDVDLAAVPPATSADVAAALVATGQFNAQRHRVDTGSFRAVVHQPTGLTVDITEYQSEGDHFISRWRHPSGIVLREAKVPAFTPVLVDVPALGRRLPQPHDADAMLTATYGDWRRPDGGFDTLVAAPNLLEFTPFLASVTSIRLADNLIAGQRDAAHRLAGILADRDIDATIAALLAKDQHADL